MMSGLNLCMPPKAVQPGDTWPVQTEFPWVPSDTVTWIIRLHFPNWELHWKRNCARLDFQSTIKTKPDPNSNMATAIRSWRVPPVVSG